MLVWEAVYIFFAFLNLKKKERKKLHSNSVETAKAGCK